MISVHFLTSDNFFGITDTQKTIEKFDRRPSDYRQKIKLFHTLYVGKSMFPK